MLNLVDYYSLLRLVKLETKITTISFCAIFWKDASHIIFTQNDPAIYFVHFQFFISPMILYFLFMNKQCLIKLSCPFLSSYSGKYISYFGNI